MRQLYTTLIFLFFIAGSVFAQNVGIGNSNPKRKLDVTGTTYIRKATGPNQDAEQIRLGRSDNDIRYHSIHTRHGSTGNNYLQFQIHNGGGSPFLAQDMVMTLRGDGNVGIGSSTPRSLLDVHSSSPILTIGNTAVNSSNAGTIDFREDVNSSFKLQYDGDQNKFHLIGRNSATDSEWLTVLRSNGNVGIGNTSPSSKLHVNGDARLQSGASVSEFSTDGTFAANSDDKLPTEQAVKEYVDGQVSGNDEWGLNGSTVYPLNFGSRNVGIGTNSAGFALEVDGKIRVDESGTISFSNLSDAHLQIGGGLGFDPNEIMFNTSGHIGTVSSDELRFVSNGSNQMWLMPDGKLGVGTSAPDQLFDVNGSVRISQSQRNEGILMSAGGANDNSWQRIFLEENDGDNYGFSLSYNGGGNNDVLNIPTNTFAISRHDNNVTGDIAMAIPRTTGNVGIGTASPQGELNINAGELLINNIGSTTPRGIVFTEGGTNDRNFEISYDGTGGGGENQLDIKTNLGISGTVMSLMANGRVGIGSSAPVDKLQITPPSTGSTEGIFIQDPSAPNYGARFMFNDAASEIVVGTRSNGTDIDAITIGRDNGNVGIGTSPSASYKLIVNGRFKSNGINETSDRRMKKDIQQLESAIGKVNQLRGVSYKWRADEYPEQNFEEDQQIGVIAQEVEKVLPEVVHTDDKGYKSVEYSHLTPLLIEAVKELSAENQRQDEALQNKDERIESLRNELRDYKQVMQQVDMDKLLEDYGKSSPVSASKK